MSLVSSFWYRLRFGLATQEVLDRLARTGITIYPYVVVDEPILVRPDAEKLDEGLEIRQLVADEAPLIAGMDERPLKESRIRELMSRATCIAVTQDDELLAYRWYTCDHFRGLAGMNVICELPPDWAYLFDMYVRPKARGRRMAVALRHHIHKLLAAQGFRRCCSISMVFNRSSRRFKEKLGTNDVELRVFLRLKPFPGLDLRLGRKRWALPTPAVHVAHRAVRPGS